MSFGTPKRQDTPDERLFIPDTPNLNSLGYGTGINVWALDRTASNSPWAIKSVRKTLLDQPQRNHLQQLINVEASILATIQHDNIIGFRAVLNATDGRTCLAMESGGRSLGDLIEERVSRGDTAPLKPQQIITVVNSIARALDYLHTEKGLLHGDIKTHNILIKDDFQVVKLCDFGVCIQLDENGAAPRYIGTTIYNAPEVLDEDGERVITSKAEIFSLGLVIWEMLSLQVPFSGSFNDTMESSEQSFSESILEEIGKRIPPPSNLGPEYDLIVKVYIACTEEEPDARPTASDIVAMLKGSHNDCNHGNDDEK